MRLPYATPHNQARDVKKSVLELEFTGNKQKMKQLSGFTAKHWTSTKVRYYGKDGQVQTTEIRYLAPFVNDREEIAWFRAVLRTDLLLSKKR